MSEPKTPEERARFVGVSDARVAGGRLATVSEIAAEIRAAVAEAVRECERIAKTTCCSTAAVEVPLAIRARFPECFPKEGDHADD